MNIKKLLTIAAVALVGMGAHADVLVSDTQGNLLGYNQPGWGQMSLLMNDAAFNAGTVIQQTPDLNNLGQVMAADALWIDQRGFGLLNPVEEFNVANFINTGKRVVIMGNETFSPWNSQVALLVGAFPGPEQLSGGPGIAQFTHELTAGVGFINSFTPFGTQLGGIPLFDSGFGPGRPSIATLHGPSANVLVILDAELFDDSHLTFLAPGTQNQQFAQNVANWVAVPEPATMGMIGLFSCGLFFYRRFFPVV